MNTLLMLFLVWLAVYLLIRLILDHQLNKILARNEARRAAILAKEETRRLEILADVLRHKTIAPH